MMSLATIYMPYSNSDWNLQVLCVRLCGIVCLAHSLCLTRNGPQNGLVQCASDPVTRCFSGTLQDMTWAPIFSEL